MKKANRITTKMVEYQGISIVKKDHVVLNDFLSTYFPGQKITLRANPHVCLEYFGSKRRIDDHIEKEESIYPSNYMGKQMELSVIGIGSYYRNGELMNIACLLDSDEFYNIQIDKKHTLADLDKANMPWVVLYTNPKTYEKDGRIRPVTSAKHSDKCFSNDKLEPNETCEFINFDEPVKILGELCAFNKTYKIFKVDNDAPRLIRNSSLRLSEDLLLNAPFAQAKEEENKQEMQQIVQAASEALFHS